jgi:hypothetical protein
MLHAQDKAIRSGRSALLAGALGLALSALLVGPAWAGTGSAQGPSVNAGKPCDGCVGNADDKTPPGQMLDGSDRNAGYECDSNKGVGRGNPAHTACDVPGGGPGDGDGGPVST